MRSVTGGNGKRAMSSVVPPRRRDDDDGSDERAHLTTVRRPAALLEAMTEPVEIAEGLEEVSPGLFHWRIQNSRIGGAISSSHAVEVDGRSVFVDPVPLSEASLASLPLPTAILVTARCHQRSAWRYRAELGATVWLPEDALPADEGPDERYADGDLLPGGLRAVRTPGPEWPHYCFLLEREPGVLFCSDLIANDGDDRLHFVPPEYHEDPAATRRSLERLLELPFATLCLAHGTPLLDDPKARVRELLEEAPDSTGGATG
jgi:hypothetical protein